jgi:hypothetical protein
MVFIKPYATIALYAAIHFMIDERTKVLIDMCPFLEIESAIRMAGHYGHILQMTRTTLIAHGTIMWVIGHKPFNHSFTEINRCLIGYRNSLIVGNRLHTRHH